MTTIDEPTTMTMKDVEMPNGGEVPTQPLPGPPSGAAALTGKRANWTIAHKVEGEGESATIHFSVKGAGALELKLTSISTQNRLKAQIHGFVQRISDAAAMARDSKTGASASPQQKYEAMKRLCEHYASGAVEWSPVRAVEGVGRPRVDRDKELLVIALGIFQPAKPTEVIQQFVQGLKKEQVSALLVSEQLRESVGLAREEMEKEAKKLSEGVDAVELLKGL